MNVQRPGDHEPPDADHEQPRVDLDQPGPARGSASHRHGQLAEWLATEGRVEVVEAAARLGVAPETVRRDLRAMESAGRLHRVHGGAIPVLPGPAASPATGQRDPDQHRRSRYSGVGTAVWQRLPRHGTLAIGAGAPALALAEAIAADPPEHGGLTVVTHALDAAITLSKTRNLAVYNIGGTVAPRTRGQEGDWAVSEFDRLTVDVSVVCPDGLTVDGASADTPAAAAVARAQVAAGRRSVALLDGCAVGTSSFVRFATIGEFDEIVIVGAADEARLRPLVDRGVALTFVGST